MAWNELDRWNILSAIAEFGNNLSQLGAQSLQTITNQISQQAIAAGNRAEYARTMWLTLDEFGSRALSELNAVSTSQLEAQLVARVETMRCRKPGADHD